MDLEQFYKDVMEYDINPSVFEFDPQPQNGTVAPPTYQDNSTSRISNEEIWFSTAI